MDENRVVTGLVRFSYAHVFEPKAANGSDTEKYSVSILIPKGDKKTIKDIQKAVEAAKQAGVEKFGGKIPASLKLPLRDGDKEREDDPAYAGCYFLNASSSRQPEIVDSHLQPIINSTEFYSGCYGHAALTFYAFNRHGNKGIACGLDSLMKKKDGEPLSGMPMKASEAFADYADDDDDFMS